MWSTRMQGSLAWHVIAIYFCQLLDRCGERLPSGHYVVLLVQHDGSAGLSLRCNLIDRQVAREDYAGRPLLFFLKCGTCIVVDDDVVMHETEVYLVDGAHHDIF